MIAHNPENRTVRKDSLEIKALLGLLYIAGMTKTNHTNAEGLFRTNGTSMENFRLTISLAPFNFLLKTHSL